MADTKTAAPPKGQAKAVSSRETALAFCRKALVWWIPVLYLLIVDAFYLRTYDSAQIKITLVQMGGICMLGLWLSLIQLEGWKAFGKEDLVVLAPFLSYLALIFFSFYRAPYRGPSIDDFVRYLFYISVAIIVIREFDSQAVAHLTKMLVIATWISVVYGFIQYIDTYPNLFPQGVGNGIDPFVWRGAFGDRIFSTFGNPNFYADFLVLIFPILVTQFLKTRNWSYLGCMALLLHSLMRTETKGAWVGFAISTAIFLVTYAYFFSIDRKRVLKILGVIALCVLVVFAGLVGYYINKRKTSVSFRVLTWLSTWEMIETQPILGTGVGSFKVIYPAFRRPGIFHIEGKHNTETDHAEDEYLEQFFDHGILGFGIFLWLVISTLWIGVAALNQLTADLAHKGGRPPPRAYDLLGYLIAFVGMLAHNSFDVSLRFVSSGIFLGLLPGVIVNLSRGFPLWWLHQRRQTGEAAALAAAPAPAAEEPDWKDMAAWPLRIALAGAAAYLIGKCFTEFNVLQGPLNRMVYGGEALLWWISWGAFWFLCLGWAYTLVRPAFIAKSLVVPLIACATLLPVRYFWGYFRADIHHNLAIFHSKQKDWAQAIENYRKVNELNPAFIMPYYFEGNVFNDRFDMTPSYHKEFGDPPDTPRTDFQRSMEAYAKVRAIAPNYVQMHHQVGVLYQKMGDYLKSHGQEKEGEAYLDRALERFKMYHDLDPVFPYNYYRMAQIYLGRRQFDKAIAAYKEYLDAPLCYGHTGLKDKIATVNHDDPEGWTYLGNAYYVAGQVQNAKDAYAKAVLLDPKNENARRNLGLLSGQSGGR